MGVFDVTVFYGTGHERVRGVFADAPSDAAKAVAAVGRWPQGSSFSARPVPATVPAGLFDFMHSDFAVFGWNETEMLATCGGSL